LVKEIPPLDDNGHLRSEIAAEQYFLSAAVNMEYNLRCGVDEGTRVITF